MSNDLPVLLHFLVIDFVEYNYILQFISTNSIVKIFAKLQQYLVSICTILFAPAYCVICTLTFFITMCI